MMMFGRKIILYLKMKTYRGVYMYFFSFKLEMGSCTHCLFRESMIQTVNQLRATQAPQSIFSFFETSTPVVGIRGLK